MTRRIHIFWRNAYAFYIPIQPQASAQQLILNKENKNWTLLFPFLHKAIASVSTEHILSHFFSIDSLSERLFCLGYVQLESQFFSPVTLDKVQNFDRLFLTGVEGWVVLQKCIFWYVVQISILLRSSTWAPRSKVYVFY